MTTFTTLVYTYKYVSQQILISGLAPSLRFLEPMKVQTTYLPQQTTCTILSQPSTSLTFWCEDLTVQLVFLVVFLLSLSHASLACDAHFRQVLGVSLCQSLLSQLLLLLVDITDTACYHGVNHWRLFGEDL